ncbi:MAG: hypothetical protein HY270_17070, partial [Deltaproteobacteria bacterium]|nr:hypothetical protein [Deltaproteobacteria bacterium]
MACLVFGAVALGSGTALATIERVSRPIGGATPDAPSFNPRTNGDGSQVVFLSAAANLVANDRNGHADIFVFDRNAGSI